MWEVELLLSAGPPFLLEGDYLLPELSALD